MEQQKAVSPAFLENGVGLHTPPPRPHVPLWSVDGFQLKPLSFGAHGKLLPLPLDYLQEVK